MDNDKRLHFVEASRKAVDILLHNNETARLYQLAVKRFGEGELQLTILNLVSDVMEDENLQSEIFASDASLLSFFSGIWIQFLLVEIAGMQKEKLQALAQKIFALNCYQPQSRFWIGDCYSTISRALAHHS